MDELKAYVGRGQRDGFTGMMAIHPAQVAAINEGFTPTDAELSHARAVIDALAAHPDAGVLKLVKKIIDRPHLVQAMRVQAASQ
jgi:citrate lyase subunit beta/citryl-CoA lyase